MEKNFIAADAQIQLNKVDEAYSSEPWWYDLRGFLILTFAYRSTLPAQVRLFGRNIGVKHLEAAIGTGTLFEMILRWRKWKKLSSAEITGFDYADRMLAGAKKRFSKEKQIILLKADAAHLELESNSFDTANIANALHCFPNVEGSLQEAHRVLKPGGTLALNCLLYPKGKGVLDRISLWINSWGAKKGILYRPYNAEEILQLAESTGFQIVYKRTQGNCIDLVLKKGKPEASH